MRIETIGDATLYLGDCLEILPTLDKVDCVVTDPPYGVGENANRIASRTKLAKTIDYGSFDWDAKPASKELINATVAAGSEVIIFGGNYFHLPPSRCWLIWDKENSGNFADAEVAWTNINGSVRLIRHMWNGMLRASENKHPRVHPTQKPVHVMEWVIGQCKKKPKTILDNFMGSGTTGVAAVQLGRKFLGFEINQEYCDLANKSTIVGNKAERTLVSFKCVGEHFSRGDVKVVGWFVH